MIKTKRRQSKYFAPQNENKKHVCDHEGCTKAGEYRAPKDRNLKEYYWFCLEHVQEYNAKWNYYGDDPFAAEQEEKPHRGFKFSSKIKYNFGFDFNINYDFFDDISYKKAPTSYLTADERHALKMMDVDIIGLDAETLKKAYKKAVKKYHPDVNTSDTAAEEKFKLLSTGYKSLLSKIS